MINTFHLTTKWFLFSNQLILYFQKKKMDPQEGNLWQAADLEVETKVKVQRVPKIQG